MQEYPEGDLNEDDEDLPHNSNTCPACAATVNEDDWLDAFMEQRLSGEMY